MLIELGRGFVPQVSCYTPLRARAQAVENLVRRFDGDIRRPGREIPVKLSSDAVALTFKRRPVLECPPCVGDLRLELGNALIDVGQLRGPVPDSAVGLIQVALGVGDLGAMGIVGAMVGPAPREFVRKQEQYNWMHPEQPLPRLALDRLRHTWATLALHEGTDIKIVSERLNHSSTHVTREIYMHVTPPMQSDAAGRVAARIFGPGRDWPPDRAGQGPDRWVKTGRLPASPVEARKGGHLHTSDDREFVVHPEVDDSHRVGVTGSRYFGEPSAPLAVVESGFPLGCACRLDCQPTEPRVDAASHAIGGFSFSQSPMQEPNPCSSQGKGANRR